MARATVLVELKGPAAPWRDGTKACFAKTRRALAPPRSSPATPPAIGAPMQGVVATVKAVVGAPPAGGGGDRLLGLEAMKEERGAAGERTLKSTDGCLARTGQRVDATDLLGGAALTASGSERVAPARSPHSARW